MIIRKRVQWQESNVSFIFGLFNRRAHILTVPLVLTIITLSRTVNEMVHQHCWWDLLSAVVGRPPCRQARIRPLELIVIIEARHAALPTLDSTLIIECVAPMPPTPFALAKSAVAAPLVFVIRA
jgi:hypothetical protein